MRLERRAHRPLALVLLAPVIAIVTALAIAGVLIAMAGAPVLEAYRLILTGAFGTRLGFTETHKPSHLQASPRCLSRN